MSSHRWAAASSKLRRAAACNPCRVRRSFFASEPLAGDGLYTRAARSRRPSPTGPRSRFSERVAPRTVRLQHAPKGTESGENAAKSKRSEATVGGGDLGLERTLFQAADKLRNHLDAAEYEHVVLGLMFLKYISDAFEELHAKLTAQRSDGSDREDRDG